MTDLDTTSGDGRDADFLMRIIRLDGTVLGIDGRQQVDRREVVAALDDAASIELGRSVLPAAVRQSGAVWPGAGVTGLLIGSLILPGVGTVAGSVLGAVKWFSDAGGSAVAGAVLVTWLRQRKSDFKLKIKRRDGTVLEVEAKRVRGTDDLVAMVATALDDAASIELTPDQPCACRKSHPGRSRRRGGTR